VPLGSAVDYEIVQEPTDRRYLVALDLPLAAPEFMRMAFDGTLYAARPQTDLSRYRASSVTSYRFEPNLPAHQRESYLALPPGFNPRTRALVAQWRAEDASPEALVQRALDWFGAEFTYTVEPQLLGRDSVDDFLFNTQEGYCEYYASAFVVMMRMAQLPARVVTGYQGAYRNTIGDYWVVRHSDAHAWTEVWQEGRGWVRVDPTSAVSPARIERGTEALSGPQPFWGRLGGPLFEAGDWLQRHWNDLVLGFNAAQQRNLLHVFGLRDGSARDFGLILGIGAGIALAITLGVLLRAPRGPRDPLRRAYAEFLARLARAGVPKAAHEGPLAYAERVASALPESAAHVRTLSQRYARWRYAATATSTSEGADLARRPAALPRHPPDNPHCPRPHMKTTLLFAVALALAGCVTAPAPLRGEFASVRPTASAVKVRKPRCAGVEASSRPNRAPTRPVSRCWGAS
jgi:transglutaminase-like putative cysteine protease